MKRSNSWHALTPLCPLLFVCFSEPKRLYLGVTPCNSRRTRHKEQAVIVCKQNKNYYVVELIHVYSVRFLKGGLSVVGLIRCAARPRIIFSFMLRNGSALRTRISSATICAKHNEFLQLARKFLSNPVLICSGISHESTCHSRYSPRKSIL